MTRTTRVLCSIIVLSGTAMAAAKPHVIAFGRSTQVRWLAGADENTPLELRARALYVDDKPDSACQPPIWERQPARVSFEATGNEKATYLIRGHSVDVVTDEEGKEGSE